MCNFLQVYRSRHCEEYIDAKREMYANWMRWGIDGLLGLFFFLIIDFTVPYLSEELSFLGHLDLSSFTLSHILTPLLWGFFTPSSTLPHFHSSGMWIVFVMVKSRILWRFSIKEGFCIVAVDPLTQDRSSWCGTTRSTLKISALRLTHSGTKSALQMVRFQQWHYTTVNMLVLNLVLVVNSVKCCWKVE